LTVHCYVAALATDLVTMIATERTQRSVLSGSSFPAPKSGSPICASLTLCWSEFNILVLREDVAEADVGVSTVIKSIFQFCDPLVTALQCQPQINVRVYYTRILSCRRRRNESASVFSLPSLSTLSKAVSSMSCSRDFSREDSTSGRFLIRRRALLRPFLSKAPNVRSMSSASFPAFWLSDREVISIDSRFAKLIRKTRHAPATGSFGSTS